MIHAHVCRLLVNSSTTSPVWCVFCMLHGSHQIVKHNVLCVTLAQQSNKMNPKCCMILSEKIFWKSSSRLSANVSTNNYYYLDLELPRNFNNHLFFVLFFNKNEIWLALVFTRTRTWFVLLLVFTHTQNTADIIAVFPNPKPESLQVNVWKMDCVESEG